MNKKINTVILAVSCLLLFSCSSVFQAGLSGTVTDSDTNQVIANVKVFAYTSKSARDSDYQAWVDKNDIYSDFNPSKAYIPRADTNENGEFTISKLTWETSNPEFGKTADYSEVYLLFYKKDYGLSKNNEDNIMIVSDSNNNSNVSQQLTSLYIYKTLNLEIVNVATNRIIDETFDLNVMLKDSDDNELEDYTTNTTITGQKNISIKIPKYKKTKDESFNDFTVDIEAKLPGSTWRQVEKDDDENYYSSNNPITKISASQLLNSDLTYKVEPIYMKNYEFTLPAFSGQIKFKDNDEDDGVRIWLATENENASKLIVYSQSCAEAGTEMELIGNNDTAIHGNFSGLGRGRGSQIKWVPSNIISDEDDEHFGDYQGKYGTIKLYFIIDNVDGTSDEKYIPDLNDRYYLYELKSDLEDSYDLPIIKLDNTKKVNDSEFGFTSIEKD